MIMYFPKLANLVLLYESARENVRLKKLVMGEESGDKRWLSKTPFSGISHKSLVQVMPIVRHLGSSTFVFVNKYLPGTSYMTGTTLSA